MCGCRRLSLVSVVGVVVLLVFSFPLVLIVLFAGACGRVGGLVSAWCLSPRARVLLRVFWRVGDVEALAFLEELFCLVGGDDAPADGWPLLRVFAACAYGEELGGELGGGYWLCGVLAVWVGVSECGVFGGGSDGVCAAVGFECEGGGDVADGAVAEVWFAGCGFFACSVVVVCVFAVQVVGVLVPGCEGGVV